MNTSNHTIRMEPQDWGFVVTLGGRPWLELCVLGGPRENSVIVKQTLLGTQQQDHNYACSVAEAAALLEALGLDAGPLLQEAAGTGGAVDARQAQTVTQVGALVAAGYYTRGETGLFALLLGCPAAPHDGKIIVAADQSRLREMGKAWVAADMGIPAFAVVDVEALPGEALTIASAQPPANAVEGDATAAASGRVGLSA